MKIPYISIPDKPITSSTQDFIPIADITDGLVLYKNGSASLIMESTSLNFGLLSEREQRAVIASYAGLIDSFTYPVQIVVRSEKKDISSYMDYLTVAQQRIQNQKLADLMNDYKNFIVDAIKKKNVLSKSFYIVIPFSQYELGVAKTFAAEFSPSKRQGPIPFSKEYVLKKARVALFPKRDHLIRQAGRLGIKPRQLNNEELLRLFYKIYNPEPPVKERFEEL